MLSGKVEKRIASSVYITLAPPRRDTVIQGGVKPEVHQPSSDHPKEATKSDGTHQPQVSPPKKLPKSSHQAGKQSSRTLGSAGPSTGVAGLSNGGFSSFPRPVLLDFSTGSDPESPLPSPPPYLLPDELNAPLVETLCPDLQKLHMSSPVSQQVQNAAVISQALDQLGLHQSTTEPAQSLSKMPAPAQNAFFPLHQASSTFPAEPKQHIIQPTSLEQVDEHQAPKQNVNGHLERDISTVCAFCHKAIAPRTPTIEAMNKQYHADCFTCRICHGQLAGQRYYQKEGRPLCNSCYKDTLEKCAKCQGLILEHIVRALGNGYHPECFMCSVCGRSIGDESFAMNDQNEVHCVDDFYRKYASICSVCETPIIPQEGKDAYRIECMGRSFHESCYRCENCRIPLSTEPAENGCYPLDSHILCKPCHIKQKNESFC
ncbi:filamin-binding LIM protein 1 isoform X1 [Dermochelys coriacea]|uniref:filamin-binding LIM protein 1 isoform X1 n=1 Tax=Dermochelys coriacea TaxID=27794 RepID=UPI001CA8E038|nr:filamin-binding LIM protein 1 isoform X1 [Dermochelys coriacea]XP_043355874.1 filamin-binding LIM protein 1 isoform X1 [Dermochelys coriacea]